MQTALSAATFFKLCKRRANDRPVTFIVNSGFAEKSRLNTAKRRQTAVVSPRWLVDTGTPHIGIALFSVFSMALGSVQPIF
jgi:hypothetical protein